MKKTVTICGNEIPVDVNAAAFIYYKNQFLRDGFKDMMSLAKATEKKGVSIMDALTADGVDLLFIYQFLWVFAYAANKKDAPSLEEFIAGFDAAPLDFLTEAVPIVMDLLTENAATTVKSRKK